jgi:hypothetical protein
MMSRKSTASVIVVALTMLWATTACSSLGTSFGEPESVEHAPAWDCSYEPSINDNWHDDVLCTNGIESFRPNLLPDSGFVTEEEMTAAGQAYEVELNG